ncbi:MAG TPA: class II D-tagatose-bisphosphate aldolase, non-catalytic subunit [Vicinamibacteria bacterium]|nr:class II D-tagatose-bisphosphate aldolase, non-catalytic subunit [Vicinamibacteria bacterium]
MAGSEAPSPAGGAGHPGLAEVIEAQKRGLPRAVPSVCSAHPVVLRAAFEQAVEDGGVVLVESTSNQVNQEGGYTGMTPAGFARFVRDLADEVGLPVHRLILGGDHLGPHPWKALPAAEAMGRAAEMVRQYVQAGCAKIHLDASMACADDPPGPLAESVIAERAAALAVEAEGAAAGGPAGSAPLYVVGTEVPTPGGQEAGHGGPAATRAEDAARTLSLTREAFARRGLERAWARVAALVVQPGVEFGDEVIYPYRREGAPELQKLAAERAVAYEAHSTDYQDEAALRQLVHDRFAILKVGPELTFAFREAVFALEAIERELLGRKPETLSGVRQALEEAMRADPRHWRSFYAGDDEEDLRLRRQYSLSDRCRYYWTAPRVQDALRRLHANLGERRIPRGLVSQYFPGAALLVGGAGAQGALADRIERHHVREVLERYARACRPTAAGLPRPAWSTL